MACAARRSCVVPPTELMSSDPHPVDAVAAPGSVRPAACRRNDAKCISLNVQCKSDVASVRSRHSPSEADGRRRGPARAFRHQPCAIDIGPRAMKHVSPMAADLEPDSLVAREIDLLRRAEATPPTRDRRSGDWPANRRCRHSLVGLEPAWGTIELRPIWATSLPGGNRSAVGEDAPAGLVG